MIKLTAYALVLCLCASATLAQPIELPRPPGTDYGYFAEEMVQGVTALHQAGAFHVQPRGNVTIIEQSNGFVLVDSGGSPAAADQIIALMARQPSKPLRAIILTHWHGDHVLGVSKLLEKWPSAKVIATPSTRDLLADTKTDRFMPGPNPQANAALQKDIEGAIAYLKASAGDKSLSREERDGFASAAVEYQQYGEEMKSARRMTPGIIVEDQHVLNDTTHPVELHFFGRANTAGDLIVWLPSQRIVITGDIVVTPIPFGFNSYPAEWIQVLERIRALNFQIQIPGHGRPARDAATIDSLIGMLKQAQQQVKPFAHDKTPLSEVIKRVDLETSEKAIAGRDPWLRRWFRAYWRDAIISSALREVRGQPVVQGEEG